MQGQEIDKPYQRACKALKSFKTQKRYASSLKDQQLQDIADALIYAIRIEGDSSTKLAFQGCPAIQKIIQKILTGETDKEQESRGTSNYRSQTIRYSELGLICSALFLVIAFVYYTTQIKPEGWFLCVWIIIGALAVIFFFIAICQSCRVPEPEAGTSLVDTSKAEKDVNQK